MLRRNGSSDTRDGLVNQVLSVASQHALRTGEDLINVNTRRGASRYVDDALLIRSKVRPGATIADVGCGVGQMTFLLWQLGFRVAAADIAYEVPPFIRAINPTDVTSGPSYVGLSDSDPDLLQRFGRQFDAVCLSGVLEHVPDFGRFLAATRSLLLPGGLLFIFRFPNKTSWIEWCNERVPHYQHDHPIRFSRRELSLFVRWYGFRVEETAYEEILPVNLGNLPDRLRGPYLRHDRLVSFSSGVLCRVPVVNSLSTSFRIVGRSALAGQDHAGPIREGGCRVEGGQGRSASS